MILGLIVLAYKYRPAFPPKGAYPHFRPPFVFPLQCGGLE